MASSIKVGVKSIPAAKPKSYPSLLVLPGNTEARSLIRKLTQGIISIEVDDPGILQDCDTESDCQQAVTGPRQSY